MSLVSRHKMNARAMNDARFGGLGDSYINECCNAVLRKAENPTRDHSNPGGHAPSSVVHAKQHALIVSNRLETRKVPVVVPDFSMPINERDDSIKNATDLHCPPVGILPKSWLTMMAPSLKEFRNPTPESERAEVAALTWLWEYESVYSELPPERKPALGDGWLGSLCVCGMLVQHGPSKKVYLSLGNETWMILLLPLVIVRSDLCCLPARITMEFHFVHDLEEWLYFPSQCLAPANNAGENVNVRGVSWQVTGPSASLLRGALMSKRVDFTVNDLTNLLRMCRCNIPSPPRKGALLYKLLDHVFLDWDEEDRRKLWSELVQRPSEETQLEGDLDEDVRSCLRNHLPPNQHDDYAKYKKRYGADGHERSLGAQAQA